MKRNLGLLGLFVALALQTHPVLSADSATDGLDEVNRLRAASGLPPFQRDDQLTQAARACAIYRAQRCIAGHVNDFGFLPQGASADAAGCAAWEPGMGWGSCCSHERWRYAGAAWALGRDGRRYMHLFVRNSPPSRPQRPEKPQPASVRFTLQVPEDAEVFFDDRKTNQSGTVRIYTSPLLEPGKVFNYEVKVKSSSGTQNKTISVKAGDDLFFQFK